MRTTGALLAIGLLRLAAFGDGNDGFNAGVDRSDPNFVTASVMVASPGDELFSCTGHVFLRLECPTFNLDYCFSDESERVSDRVFTFLAGNLKMGLFAVPTGEMLEEYRKDRRGVRQYRLDLPADVKQRLWRILDEEAAKGANIPYDYDTRGCAKSVLNLIRRAAQPTRLETTSAAERATGDTRREMGCTMLGKTHPWNLFLLNGIVGVEADNFDPVVTPQSLVNYLRTVKLEGRPVVPGEGVEILKGIAPAPPGWLTPIRAAGLLVVLSLVNWFIRKPFIDWAFLAFQTALGFFFVYLTAFSGLPTAHWNWLLVPFNPLPLVFWRWRRYWAWPFAAVLVAWEAFMLLSPHQLTDWAYVVIVIASVVFYVRQGKHIRQHYGI